MNAETIAKSIIPRIHGTSVAQHWDPLQLSRIRFAAFPPGCCLQCGQHMSPDQILPPGRQTKRAICPTCWHSITSDVSGRCLQCGYMLENDQATKQQTIPRDIHHRLHAHAPMQGFGSCRDLFCLCTAHALGINTGLAEQQQTHYGHQALPGVHDYVDAEWTEVQNNPLLAINHGTTLQRRTPKALPKSQQMLNDNRTQDGPIPKKKAALCPYLSQRSDIVSS